MAILAVLVICIMVPTGFCQPEGEQAPDGMGPEPGFAPQGQFNPGAILPDFHPVPSPCKNNKCCDTREAKFDLSTGESSLGPEGIELDRPIQSIGNENNYCGMGGRLKINFEAVSQKPLDVCMDKPQGGRRMLKLEFFFSPNDYRSGWMFNIGDSVTNNGYGGDGGTQRWDAEIDGRHPDLFLYSNDVCKDSGVPNLWKVIHGVLGEGVDKITMYIANGFIRVVAGHVDTRVCSRCLFATNGQADSNPNTDIYVGLNSVVSGMGGRIGRGLCKVNASWVCPRIPF